MDFSLSKSTAIVCVPILALFKLLFVYVRGLFTAMK